jgi:hypothetical protein
MEIVTGNIKGVNQKLNPPAQKTSEQKTPKKQQNKK